MEFIIKYNTIIEKIIIGILACVMVSISGLLFIEYQFFKKQALKMQMRKQEYRTYVLAVKKILNDYNTLKEASDQAASNLPHKKKNNDEIEFYQIEDDPFVILNRDTGYLKQATVEYVKECNMDFVLDRINFDEWLDYNEQLVAHTQRRKSAQKSGKRSKRARTSKRLHSKVTPHKQPDMLFAWPIDQSKFWLSSYFGPRRKPGGKWGFHYGLDMAALRGTPVKAAAGGNIIEARYARGYGKTVVVQHSRKYKTRYAHLDKILVKVGQKVKRGQLIGKVGDTGFVRKAGKDASHLHFEVYAFGKRTNPMYFLHS